MPPFWRKREPSPPANEAPPAPEDGPRTLDETVSPFFAARDWEGLIGALERIDPEALEAPEAVQWYTSRGIGAEQLGRREEAVSAYREGARRHPESSTLHAVAGRLLEEEGRFDEALPHFRSVRLDDGGGNAVMTAARYCYLWDALEDAIALQAQIFTAYFALKIADDHFLYTRRLPFFTEAFGAQAAVLVLSGREGEAEALLGESEASLSDLHGVEEERLTLEATLGRPSGLIEHRSDETGGYGRMQLAAWQARATDQPAAAKERLASVTLQESDFRWLEDIRLLAMIAADRRARDLRTDDPRISDFFARQPRLFEPEHAFHFGLLEEQEALKEHYRVLRRDFGPPSWGK
jgi:tetratricopeptide (TPR) repeat protein